MCSSIFVIVGPTGVGKTEIAVELARRYDLDIISADSRQIYKYMDIGTAKPILANTNCTIHMIDIITPDVLYSAADFAQDCKKIMEQLFKRKRKFVLVGGSGLYLKALFEPFFKAPPRDVNLRNQLTQESLEKLYERLKHVDPISAKQIQPKDRQRIIRALEIYEQTKTPLSVLKQMKTESEYLPYYVGITMERKKLYEKIDRRFDKMIKDGLITEVKRLLQLGYSEKDNAMNGIGYREILKYLKGELSLNRAIEIAKYRSHQYAKRQITWFKKIPNIKWIEYTTFELTFELVRNEYENYLKSHK
ncbi:MAG: tRNA (adenosine(37)-N6)-dimethylallyltransferase MiaA [candidate division WOR-3 bacterium]|nr:tRNA (adenosine(37)-N6)-dimethylallyltransferase MiaA [candidate division WOR-3 bacterium]